jgi:hypothetical protein
MAKRILSMSRNMAQRVFKCAVSTTTTRCTALGAIIAATLAVCFVPPLGVAVLGTAFTAWWVAVAAIVFVGAVTGNAIGANRTVRKERASRP